MLSSASRTVQIVKMPVPRPSSTTNHTSLAAFAGLFCGLALISIMGGPFLHPALAAKLLPPERNDLASADHRRPDAMTRLMLLFAQIQLRTQPEVQLFQLLQCGDNAFPRQRRIAL